MVSKQKAVEQPTETKVVVTPPEDTTKEIIEGLREDIKKQYHIQTDVARIGFYTSLRNQGITEIPQGEFTEEFQKIIYATAERYPFALAPTEITGFDDGNVWLDNHPIPTGYDNIEPYEEFLDDLEQLEYTTRYRLKMDTMEEHGHSNMDIKKIESIGEYGHISIGNTPEEELQNNDANALTKEEFMHLKQTAIDYFKYRNIWLNPKHTHTLDDEIFDINIIKYFKRKGDGGGGDREERELIDELNHFADEILDDGCRV